MGQLAGRTQRQCRSHRRTQHNGFHVSSVSMLFEWMAQNPVAVKCSLGLSLYPLGKSRPVKRELFVGSLKVIERIGSNLLAVTESPKSHIM